MSAEQRQSWLAESAKVVAYINEQFLDAVNRYNLRARWNPIDQAWYVVTGINESQKLFFDATSAAVKQLVVMRQQVPYGGDPHGDVPNWVAVWTDLASDTEARIRENFLFVSRSTGFNAMLESLRAYSATVEGFVGGAGKTLSFVSVAIAAAAVYLAVREASGLKRSKA